MSVDVISVSFLFFKAAVKVEHTPTTKRPMEAAILKLHDQHSSTMKKLFDIAYFLAKEERPFTDFPKLIELEKRHGVNLGEMYANDKSAKMFTMAIGTNMLNSLKTDLKNSEFPYFSVLSDGSTDRASSEKELIYIRLLKDGSPELRFIGIQDVERADAPNLLKVLEFQLSQVLGSDWRNACIGAGADGAAVNFGHLKGLMTLLRKEMPWLVTIHCVAHRLELACKDAFKNTYFQDVVDILDGTFNFYSNSPKRLRELKTVGEMSHEEILKPSRTGGTRWLGHKKSSMDVFLRNYPIIIKHWEDATNPIRKDIRGEDRAKMEGWLKKIKNYKFLLHLSFYADIISQLALLSLTFQKDNLSISDVNKSVKIAQQEVARLKDNDGPRLSKFKTETKINEDNTAMYISNSGLDESLKLKNVNEGDKALEKERLLLVKSILEKLHERYSDMDKKDNILKLAEVFDATNWPENDDLCDYGIEEIKAMLKHFKPILEKHGCDLIKSEEEWQVLKLHAFSLRTMPYHTLWKRILQTKKELFPNILHLLAIVLVFPLSTAALERMFSTMKRVMTDWRAKLNTDTMATLMRISHEGPQLSEFDPLPCVQEWQLSGPRRAKHLSE